MQQVLKAEVFVCPEVVNFFFHVYMCLTLQEFSKQNQRLGMNLITSVK